MRNERESGFGFSAGLGGRLVLAGRSQHSPVATTVCTVSVQSSSTLYTL